MSRIDDLIEDKCPEGVTFKPLREVTNLTAGDRIIKSMMSDDADYPVMGGGDKPTGRYNDFNFEHSVTISRAGSAGSVNWLDSRFWATDVCFVASQKKDGPDIKFVYYYLCSQESVLKTKIYGGNLPKLNKQFLWELPIPLPPLEIQQEIVRMLNSFTELEAELEAELVKRKQQYEYYKELVFITAANNNSDADVKDLVNDKFWLMPATPKFIDNGVPYITSKNVRGGKIDFQDVKYISQADYDAISRSRSLKKGDLLITMIGTIGETAFVEDEKDFYGQNIYVLRFNEEKCLREYFYYFLSQDRIKNGLISRKNASSQGYIKAGAIDNLKVPIPPIAEQQRIVYLLGAFDSVCNDITVGLPAEIETRHKQYEYYRDKLLSFKELKEDV